jgi:hypothetical protein
MADIHKFSEQMIDVAERLSNVADAAAGKRMSKTTSGWSGWVVLPAAGAGLYALLRSDFVSKQARGVVDEARSLASDLPNDLMKSVRRTTQKQSPSNRRATTQNSSRQNAGTQKARGRSGARRRRQPTGTRKTTAGR